MPSESQIQESIRHHFGSDDVSNGWSAVLAKALSGMSFAEAERELLRAKRQSVMQRETLISQLQKIVQERAKELPREERSQLAIDLMTAGLSQRESHEWTGVSRDTIRKAVNR
jgi:hypothetical protein